MNNYLSTLTSISTDTLIVGGLVALFFFIAVHFGKGYITAIIISVYVSIFLYGNAFFVQNLVFVENEPDKLFWNHLGIMLLFLIPVFYVLKNIVTGDYGRRGKVIGAGLMAIGAAGLVISIFYQVLPITPVYDFSAGIDSLFSSDKMLTVWLILPLILLFF